MPAGMSAEEVREHLTTGKDLPVPVTLVGFVEAGDEGYLSFSPGASCDKWVPLPFSLVSDAVPLGVRRCNDHTHNLLRLELRISDDPEAKALQALIEIARRENFNHAGQNPQLL